MLSRWYPFIDIFQKTTEFTKMNEKFLLETTIRAVYKGVNMMQSYFTSQGRQWRKPDLRLTKKIAFVLIRTKCPFIHYLTFTSLFSQGCLLSLLCIEIQIITSSDFQVSTPAVFQFTAEEQLYSHRFFFHFNKLCNMPATCSLFP